MSDLLNALKNAFSQIPWDSPILWAAIISSIITTVGIILNGIFERRARYRDEMEKAKGNLFSSLFTALMIEREEEYGVKLKSKDHTDMIISMLPSKYERRQMKKIVNGMRKRIEKQNDEILKKKENQAKNL